MPAGDQRPPARLHVTVASPDNPAARAPGLARWLERVAPARIRGEVVVALVSDGRMRVLNRTYRGADYATDVLSFPAAEAPGADAPLGDIVIASGVARRQAAQAGHSLQTELRVLALHGLLHLLGYDHERDAGQMARLEARLRRKGGLREGLIQRGRAAAAPAARGRR
jgi:probable rRNA maturation factor